MYKKTAPKTAWSKPKPKAQNPQSVPATSTPAKDSNKGKEPRSKQVRELDALIESLQTGVLNKQAGTGGCFCLARTHGLSPHCPLCLHCGFIVCELQHPVSPCPSCHSPLLSPNATSLLIAKLESEKANVLAKEAAQREAERLRRQEIEATASGGGAFPVLPGTRISATTPSSSTGGKVLSLNSKTRKVTVTPLISPARTPPPKTRPDEVESEQSAAKIAVSPPSDQIDHFPSNALDPNRKWKDLRGEGLMYLAAPKPTDRSRGAEGSKSGGRRRRKGKESQAANTDAPTGSST
jgi:hypothetical protein